MTSESSDKTIGDDRTRDSDIPFSAFCLGFAGLVPFVSLSFILIADAFVDTELSRQLLIGYAIAIASFLGGVEWGAVMREVSYQTTAGLWRYFALSIVSPLAVWAAFTVPKGFQFFWLSVIFAMLFIIDFYFFKRGLFQSWYMKLRRPLSLIVIICLSLVGIHENL